MTNEAMNVVIAEVCGWTDVEEDSLYESGCSGKSPDDDHYAEVITCGCPDYATDLNAMHEAEKTLSESQCALYVDNLNSIQAYDAADDVLEEMIVFPCEHKWFHATARQRAEAFLRTVGKWMEVAV